MNRTSSLYQYNVPNVLKSIQYIHLIPASVIQYGHSIPVPVNQTSASAWLYKQPWRRSQAHQWLETKATFSCEVINAIMSTNAWRHSGVLSCIVQGHLV